MARDADIKFINSNLKATIDPRQWKGNILSPFNTLTQAVGMSFKTLKEDIFSPNQRYG
jgi:hypothetical protein